MNFLTAIRRLTSKLVQYEIWPVAGMIAASFVWTSLLPAAVITAAFFWPLRWIASGRLTRRTPADGAILILLLLLPVTLWATALPAITILQVYRLLTGIAFFYAIVNWCDSSKRMQVLLLGVTLAGMLLALFAAFSVQWPVGKLAFISSQFYQDFAVWVSDTVHPNVLAGSLVMLLPIPLARLLFAWGKTGLAEKIIYGETSLVMLAVLALTQSRGAWIAMGLVVLTLIVLRWRRGWLIFILALIFVLVFVSQFGIPRLLELAFSSGSISGWDGRREIWSRAIYMIQDFPFTGIGMGSFGQVADALYPFFSYSPGSIPHAHNLLLQIAVDLGIPGLIAWLAILVATCIAAWKVFRYGRTHEDFLSGALGAGLLCSQLALVVHGMTDAVTWGMVRPAPLVWVIWGLAFAAWHTDIRTEKVVPLA